MPLYGSQIWNLSCTSCTRFISNWYKAVRRIFNLPPMCHRRFEHQIAGDMPVEMQLLCGFLTFSLKCMKNNNNVLKMCSLLAINGSRSPACKNINLVIHKFIIPRGLITNYGSYYHVKHLMTKHIVHDTPTITFARELIDARDTIQQPHIWRDNFNTK